MTSEELEKLRQLKEKAAALKERIDQFFEEIRTMQESRKEPPQQ